MEGVIAVVTTVAYDFAPKNWAFCNGQIMSIAQNQALFSLLGTTYGGNGVNTFGLPDLRGRTALSQGTSTTGTSYQLGEVSGSTTASMGMSTMPAHLHNGPVTLSIGACSSAGYDGIAENNNIGSGLANTFSTNDNTTMAVPNTYQATVGIAGSGIPFSVLNPYLVLNYVICLYGLFPSRN